MATNGTGITREEAETIINLMKLQNAEHSSGSIAVLKKLQKAYPDLLVGTPFAAMIAEHDRKITLTKNAALKIISEKVEGAYKLIREAEETADKANVSFSFDMHGTYGMGGTYHKGGWTSSSDNC